MALPCLQFIRKDTLRSHPIDHWIQGSKGSIFTGPSLSVRRRSNELGPYGLTWSSHWHKDPDDGIFGPSCLVDTCPGLHDCWKDGRESGDWGDECRKNQDGGIEGGT